MAQTRNIMVRVTEAQHKAVRVKAAELGCPVSEIVRALLDAWVAGDIVLQLKEDNEGERQDKH